MTNKKQNKNMIEKNLVRDKNLIVNYIKLMPNKKIGMHKHKTRKFNYILKGEMIDGKKKYKKGDLVINKKGSKHFVKAGKNGCEFLIIWNI